MAQSSYVFKNEEGEFSYLSGICNLLGDFTSLKLDNLDLESGEEFILDLYLGNIESLEKELKRRFSLINEQEYLVGSSSEKENKDIDKITLRYNEIDEKFDDIFFLLFNKSVSARKSIALRSLSKELANDLRTYFEDDFKNIKIYLIKGIKEKGKEHAYDYFYQVTNTYAVVINGKYTLLFLSGTFE